VTARIRWEEARYASVAGHSYSGHVGTLDRAFLVWGDAGCWTLSSALPGLADRYRRDDDPGALKLAAEDWLEEFVTSLGAVFPDEAVQDPGWCPACWHMWSLHAAGGCTAKVYPAHSLTGKPCPCEHAAGEERGEEAGAGPGEGRRQ